MQTYSSQPASALLGFHVEPPAREQLDYDESEANRVNVPVSILMGAFIVKGLIRISAQSDLATTISTARIQWMSIYEASISSSQLPQMPPIQTPMLLVRTMAVLFVIGE